MQQQLKCILSVWIHFSSRERFSGIKFGFFWVLHCRPFLLVQYMKFQHSLAQVRCQKLGDISLLSCIIIISVYLPIGLYNCSMTLLVSTTGLSVFHKGSRSEMLYQSGIIRLGPNCIQKIRAVILRILFFLSVSHIICSKYQTKCMLYFY